MELLIATGAFIVGYGCGLLTKHEIWVWVKKNGKKITKNNKK